MEIDLLESESSRVTVLAITLKTFPHIEQYDHFWQYVPDIAEKARCFGQRNAHGDAGRGEAEDRAHPAGRSLPAEPPASGGGFAIRVWEVRSVWG